MTNQEFSNEFDVLYNNITSNQAPGLNEYEKSVFLTKAQSQLVNEYFNSRVDGFGGGFDGSQKRQYDFSTLVKVSELNEASGVFDNSILLDRRSKVFVYPEDYYLSVNELLTDSLTQYVVVPINHLEYARLMSKPYGLPQKKQVWRMFNNEASTIKYSYHYTPDANDNLLPDDYNFSFIKNSTFEPSYIQIQLPEFTEGESIAFENNHRANAGFILEEGEYKFYLQTGGFGLKKDNQWEWFVWIDPKDTMKIVPRINENYKYFPNPSIEPTKFVYTISDYKVLSVLKSISSWVEKCKCSISWNKEYENSWAALKLLNACSGFKNWVVPFGKYYWFSELGDSKNPKDDDPTGTKYLGCKKTRVITSPLVEIIGKFKGSVSYKLRYIAELPPIILTNLDDFGEELSIGGVSKISECKLPEEAHQEVLERAVTLAKIAWQGATATQVANQQRESRQ